MNRGISRREFCHYGAWTLTGLGLSRFALQRKLEL